jgi:hypothetical protein
MPLEQVDLSEHNYAPDCDMGCGRKAVVIAQGCRDKEPVVLCQDCLDVGIHRIEMAIKMFMRFNKRVMICGDCHRPIINLDTHLDVRKLGE